MPHQLPAPQTPLALPNYADPVAIAEAQAAPAMSPVPQADVSKPPSRRQPTARPQAPIPDVITDAEITGTGALADALRAAQRKAQFVLAEQQREQQAYNNAILQRAEQQSTKLSVDAVSNNVNDIRAMGNRRTINGFNLLSEDQKTKILDEYFNNNPRELLIYVRNTPTAQARQFLAYAAGVDVAHFNRAPVPANDSQMQMSRAPGQETTGDVFLPVYKGEDGALVMSLTENGKPIYLGVTSDGKTDVRDINDRSLDRNGPYSPQLLAKLREQAAAHEANEMALAVNQGVFVGAQNNIVASDSVSADNIGMLQDWMEMLGLGNVKVFFADFKDLSNPNARERYGLYGPYRIGLAAQQFSNYNGVTSPMGEGHVIAIDFSKSPATVMEAIGHELGHIVQQRGFDTATESTRAAVMRGFAAWTEKNIGKDLADVIRSVRTPSSYRDAVAALSNLQTPEQTAKFRNYVTSFNEYFADNVARYLLANPKKPTTLVDRFFAQVAKLLRPLINLVNSGFTTTAAPDPAVKDFLDAMRAGAVIPNATTVPASFNALKLPDALSSAGLTPERLNEASKRLASTAKDVAGAVLGGKRQRSRQLRQAELYITSPGHIVEQYGGLFVYNGKDALRDKYNAQQSGTALAASMARLHSGNYEAWQRLQKASKSAANNQIELMALTALRINPTKTWSEHTWLQDQPNAAALKSKVDRANNLYRNLQSQAFPDGKTYASVYDDAVVNMEMLQYANVSMALRNLVAQDPELSKMLPSFAADPMEEYRAAVSTTITSPTPSRDFWKSYLKDRMTEVQQYLALQRGAVDSKSLTKQSQQQIVRRISPLEKQMQSINVALSVMEEAPYFHLGRYGEYFVAFKLATGEDGSVDPKAIKALQDDLGKNGFENVVIESDNLNPDVYIRVETPDASEKLYERVVELQRKGVVSDKQEPIRAKRGDENLNFAGQPEWLQRFIQNVTAAYEPSPDMSEAQKKQMLATKSRLVSTMQEMYLDMMPDTAINKVMVRREGVQGFEADMMRNFSWRMQVGINSLVNMSVAQKNSEAIITMRAAIKEARSNRENDNVYAMQDVLDEVLTRDQNRSVFLQRSFLDLLRATNHAYFLGMSPSYVGLQFTQLGVLLWPELSKRHGFVDSAKVIGKVTPLAFKVMRATFQEGKSLGAHRVTDAVINENVLERAGITGADAKFVLDAVAHGFIDIGGASREMGRAADGRMGDKWDTALRYASAFGYYSETMTRLIAALSARELHNSDTRSDKGNLMDYVRQTVEQSMFNYQTTNEARILSKNGIAGPITPLATAFYKYTASLLEKMYREIGRAFFNQARTEAEKTEARRFLVSHALAVATVSGTMGLPFASAFFRAAEKIADAFGDDGEEPADFKAAYRNMLADMFGKDAGEVIARGLPRAFGFDIASRAGEQDILPFTRLLADRRKWDEATKDWAVSAFGSPFSMVNNIISGGSDIANGDRMEGAKKLLPVALKGPLEAYNMAENGYVDKKGQALPMTAGASDIAYQMLGFTPSNKAEYNEARLNQIARRGEMTRMASDMRRQIAVAIERGDRDTARELMSQAANFDRQNPAFAVLPTLSSTLHSRARARALAEGLGTPLGVSPKDVVGQALTDYANY